MPVVDKAMGHEKYKYQVIYDVHLVIIPFLLMAWNTLKAHFRLIWIASASLVIRLLLKYKIKINLTSCVSCLVISVPLLNVMKAPSKSFP